MAKRNSFNKDYVINESGYFVFTRSFHLRRGFCCGSSCMNCPYDGIRGSRRIIKKVKKAS